jgi:hypothetical protein
MQRRRCKPKDKSYKFFIYCIKHSFRSCIVKLKFERIQLLVGSLSKVVYTYKSQGGFVAIVILVARLTLSFVQVPSLGACYLGLSVSEPFTDTASLLMLDIEARTSYIYIRHAHEIDQFFQANFRQLLFMVYWVSIQDLQPSAHVEDGGIF